MKLSETQIYLYYMFYLLIFEEVTKTFGCNNEGSIYDYYS